VPIHTLPVTGSTRIARISFSASGEFCNAVERALIFHQDGPLGVDPPPADALDPAVRGAIPLNLTLEEAEARYIALVLEANADVELNEIARRLGISRKTLWKRRRRYGL
jgi:DNA-binding NtrC family response regulator